MSEPGISDFEFDKLLEELIKLEKDHPEYLKAESPSQRVGGQITKEFKNVKHKYPMLSLGNTYNETDLRDFDERIRKSGLTVSTSGRIPIVPTILPVCGRCVAGAWARPDSTRR